MLREVRSITRTAEGIVCRIAYRGNRAVDVYLPASLRPKHVYLDTYEFTEEANAAVVRAIAEHEDALDEQRRLG
jgi:hypothetical protein